MEDQKIIKTNINQHLRYGDLSKIQRLVLEKKKRTISVSHVRAVLNTNMDRWDDDVIEEAQELVIKSQQALIKAKERIV